MKTVLELQRTAVKNSTARYGASPDPTARVKILNNYAQRLTENPRDLTAVTKCFLGILDLAHRVGVNGDTLVSLADQQNRVDEAILGSRPSQEPLP